MYTSKGEGGWVLGLGCERGVEGLELGYKERWICPKKRRAGSWPLIFDRTVSDVDEQLKVIGT